MGSRSGFNADGTLGEIRNVVDNGSGAIAVSQRVANVLVNLGLTAGTASGGDGSGVGANGTPVTPGTAQASTVVVLDASKNFTGINNLTVANLTVTSSEGFTGAQSITATSVNALAVGQNGVTNPIFNVNTNTASAVAGLNITGAVTGGTVAIATTDSGAANNLTINALGTGTIGIGSVSTGRVTITPVTTITGALTAAGGVTVSASGIAVTGTSSIAGATTISVGSLTLTTGTATVAPLLLAAGTNLTTAAAGAVEFDGTAFYATALASTRQVVSTEQFVRLTADYTGFTSTSASAQQAFNATTNGALTLEATTTYAFEAEIYITNTGTSSHTWAFGWGLAASASVTQYSALLEAVSATSNALTALTGIWCTSVTPVVCTAASTSATENVFLRVRGYLSTNVAGASNTFTPQLKLSATTGTGSSVAVKAGSYLRIWPVGSNTVASVGNWS